MKILQAFPTLIFFLMVFATAVSGYLFIFEGVAAARQPYTYWAGSSLLTYAVLYL